LQEAGVLALDSPSAYYDELAAKYRERRDMLLGALNTAGFRPWTPQGAYYILCDIGHFGFSRDTEFVQALIERAGVAAVPGSSFFARPEDGRNLVRFCFCKREETLREAGDRLLRFAQTS
jgi:aminotransferase